MQDRQSMNPNRITFTDENSGITYTGTWAYADNPVVDGTLMNKAAFLQDATATAIGLTQEDPTVNDALAKLQTNINTKVNASSVGAASGLATLDSNTKVVAAQTSSRIVNVTANKTLAMTDAGSCQLVSSTNSLTITIPLNSAVAFPVQTEIEFVRMNTGGVTFAAASGATIVSVNNKTSIPNRYGCACLKKIDADTWLLAGDLG